MIAPIIMQFEAVVSATPLDLHKTYGNDLEHPEDDVVIGNNLITVENVFVEDMSPHMAQSSSSSHFRRLNTII